MGLRLSARLSRGVRPHVDRLGPAPHVIPSPKGPLVSHPEVIVVADIREEVEQYFRDFAEAVNSGDVDAFMNTQTPDVVWNPPDRATISGPDDVRKYLVDEWFGPSSMQLDMTVQEALPVADEYTCTRGSWSIDLTPKDGSEASTVGGTFMWLLRKEGGEIKGARTSFAMFD